MEHNINFDFWKIAYGMGCASISQLRQAVKTIESPFGEISENEFKEICGEDFNPVIKPQPTPVEKPIEQPDKPVENIKTIEPTEVTENKIEETPSVTSTI